MRSSHDATTGPQKDYMKAQDGVWKDIEHPLGVHQGLFRVMRHNRELCDVEKVVLMSEVRKMLQKVLMMMHQTGAGAFDEELAEEDNQTNLMQQFIWEGVDLLFERGHEAVTNRAVMTAMQQNNESGTAASRYGGGEIAADV